MSNGFHNRMVRINLSTNQIKTETLPVNAVKNFMGGKGLGAFILTNELDSGIDPLGPENKIIVTTGPLQGSVVPICGRYCIVTKSPLTGLFLDSHAGGYIGPELKFAGWDAIVIEGVAKSPCFLSIIDDDIQLKDGEHLKGLTTLDKEFALKEELGESRARIMSIGPAGENLVKFACVTSDSFRNIGRGGVGAVFGSKNLLAIAIKGSNKNLPVANEEKLKQLAKNLRERAAKGREVDHWIYQVGTPALVNFASQGDQIPVRNFQFGTVENPEEFGREAVEAHKTRKIPCYKCVIQCAHVFSDDYSFKDHKYHIAAVPEYETLGLIGTNCDVKFETVVEANYLLNKLGLDSISAGSVCAFFMECSEKGLVPTEYTEEKIMFGDEKGLLSLIHKIAYREGVGELLAEGTRKTAEVFGHDSHKFAINVKGLDMAAWDPRGKLALGLSYATAAVGASHLRGWPSTSKLPKDEEVSPEIVRTLIESTDLKLVKDSLIICHFTHSIIPALDIKDTQALYEAVTGSSTNVVEIAQNIWSLTRYFNMREFMIHKNPAGVYDTLPHRILNEPLPTGSAAGSKAFISKEDFQQGLKYLYDMRRCKDDGDLTDIEVTRIKNLVGI
ncbi:hypothetical protein CEE45_09620 [Candidatus Heimdallarchaeota archaeon B3_Heim]|nr:MAG: hypothetical protein CEE45_09620 [Candidatus Heimdallarchaeota archaeon B3_Heim]